MTFTTEKTLEILYKVHNTENLNPVVWNEVGCLIKDLETEIKQKSTKSTGKGNLFKAMNNVIKYSIKSSSMRLIHGAWKVDDWTYVCDGHQIIRTREEIELPMVELKDGKSPLNVQTFLEGYDIVDVEYDCDTLAELKTNLKMLKAKAKADGIKNANYLYKLSCEYGDVFVNLEFLINMVSAFGKKDSFKIYQTKGGRANPVFIVGENTHMMLMPVNHKSKDDCDDKYIIAR